jgi:hypothetical protein
MMKDGKATLDLSKDEKPVLPTGVEPLRAAMLELMPHARLADVFLEVEDWMGFRDDFPHLNGPVGAILTEKYDVPHN